MEVIGGSMNYSIGFEYEQLLKGAKQILAALGNIDAQMSVFGDSFDDWNSITKESIDIQKKYIKELEKEYEKFGDKGKELKEVLAKHGSLTAELEEARASLAELQSSGTDADIRKQSIKVKGLESSLKGVENRINTLKESLSKRDFLSSEIESEKQVLADMESAFKVLSLSEADLSKQLSAVKNKMKELAAAGLEDTDVYKELSEEATRLGRQLKNFDRNFKRSIDPMRTFQIAQSLRQVARSIEEIGKASGNANLEKTGGLINALADGVQGYLQGGWWGVLIAGIGETISRVSELVVESEQLDIVFSKLKSQSFADEINKLLNPKKIDNIFGTNALSDLDKVITAFSKAKKAAEDFAIDSTQISRNYSQILTDFVSPAAMIVANIRGLDSEMETFLHNLEKGREEAEALPLTIKKTNWFADYVLGLRNEYKSLGDVMEENGIIAETKFGIPSVNAIESVLKILPNLSEAQKAVLENMKSIRKGIDDSLEGISDYLNKILGQVSSSIADNMVESFIASGNAVTRFDSILADLSKTLAKEVIQFRVIGPILESFREEIFALYDGTTKVEDSGKKLAEILSRLKDKLNDPELKKVIDEILNGFKGLFGGDSGLAARLEEEAQAIAQAQNMRIEAMKKGYDKEVAQIKASRQQERDALQREISDSNGMLSGGTIKALREQIELSKQLEEKELRELEEKWEADKIKAQQNLDDLSEKQNKKTLDRQYEMQQAIIDQMDDGLGKELAQMTLNHEKKMEAIRRNAEAEAKEMAEANRSIWEAQQTMAGITVKPGDYEASAFYKTLTSNGLTAEQQQEADEKLRKQQQEANAITEKQTEDALSKSLQKYNVYTARKKAIDKKYNADIEALYKKRNQYAEGSKEWVEIDNAITQAFKDQREAIIDLNAEYTELNTLIAESESLGKRIETIKGGGTDIEGKTLEELEKAKKEVDKKIASMQHKSFKELWDEQKNTLVANSIDQVTGALYGLADASGSLNARQTADFMNSLSMGAKGLMSGGVIGLLIAGIEDTLAQFSDAIIGAEALASSLEGGKLEAWRKEMANIMEQGGGIFGEDAVSNVRNAVAVLEESRQKLRDFAMESQSLGEVDFNRVLEATNLLSWRNWATGFAETENEVLAYFDAIVKGYSDLEAHVFRTQNRGWLLNFFGIDDRYNNLKDMAKDIGIDELYDKYGNLDSNVLQSILDTYTDLSDADRKWIEKAIAYSDQYTEAMEQIASYLDSLFGDVADNIADKMIDSFMRTGDAAVDLGEMVGDIGKKMAKDLLKSMILERYFTGLKDDFLGKIEEEGGMTANAAAYIIQQMNNAMSSLDGETQYWNQVLAGLSTLWGDAEAASIAEGNTLSSSSQESIDLMNGQLNAMRAYQGRMEGMMNSVLLQLSGIHNDMNTNHNETIEQLKGININTSKEGLGRALGAYFG